METVLTIIAIIVVVFSLITVFSCAIASGRCSQAEDQRELMERMGSTGRDKQSKVNG